ncbi:unnamed protein product, partial [Adineta steineri]
VTTASSVTTSCETLTPTKINNTIQLKNDFINKILVMKNESSNNPVFTLERYKQIIELINDAELKSSNRRTDQEISLLKAYDVLNIGNEDKLVKTIHGSEDTLIKYYAPINELYDIIRIAHSNIKKQVKLFISECNECKIKRAKPRNSSKLVIRPIISNDFNSRGQVDLIDMQSSPDGEFKFILNYQDHFTKFSILRPLKSKTAAEVAFNLSDIFTTFGAPAILQSRTWIHKNNSTKWAEGLRFVQYQKNACFHRILNNSPYAVLFGNESKLGLSSTSLNPSIFNDITTEEELINEFGILTNDVDDVNSCTSDSEQDGLKFNELIIAELNDNNQLDNNNKLDDNNVLNIIEQNKNNNDLLTNRVKKTNNIREVGRHGQKRQADEFLQNITKRHKLADLNVGDNVLVPVPDVDRGPTDARNVLAVIIVIKDDKYKLGVEQGVINNYYSFNQFSKAPGIPTILIRDVDQSIKKSLREVVRLQSVTGGQGFLKCSCKGGCSSSRCKCKKINFYAIRDVIIPHHVVINNCDI